MSLKEISQRVGKCTNVTKIIMGICFLILFLLGLILFICGAISLAGASVFKTILPVTSVREVIIFALCLGLFVALVSIVGSIGYFLLIKPMLVGFMVGMLILVVLEVTCCGLAFGYRDSFATGVEYAWQHAEPASRAYIEVTYDCCGGANTTDLPSSPQCTGVSSSVSPLEGAGSTSGSYNGACVPIVVDILQRSLIGAGTGILVVTLLEIIAVIATIAVVVQINKAQKYQRFKSSDSSLDPLRDNN